MGKNKKWDYETKIEMVESLINGRSYSSIIKEYGVSSKGMVANWKRMYLEGTLKDRGQGRPVVNEESDYEMLKKCYAQLMKIRSK